MPVRKIGGFKGNIPRAGYEGICEDFIPSEDARWAIGSPDRRLARIYVKELIAGAVTTGAPTIADDESYPPGCTLSCVDNRTTYGGSGAAANIISPGADDNTVLGYQAMYNNETGDRNVVIGSGAAYDEAAVGGGALYWSVVIGYQAGYRIGDSGGTGYAVAIGYKAMYGASGFNYSSESVYIGYQCGYNVYQESANVFIGTSAGYSFRSGSNNVVVGAGAGLNFKQCNTNTAIGDSALANSVYGDYNVAVGESAGIGTINSNSDFNFNVFVGANAGWSVDTNGDNNIAIGYQAAFGLTTGTNNVAIGYQAGYSFTTATGNVFLGYKAGYNETGSNKLYIENSDSASPLIYGEFDNDLVRINGSLEVTGGLAYGTATELTISSGSITRASSFHKVDTESDAASDDLDTISGGAEGDLLILRAENSLRTVVCKNGTGNMQLAGDFPLDDVNDIICLIYDGSNWLEVSRSDNA